VKKGVFVQGRAGPEEVVKKWASITSSAKNEGGKPKAHLSKLRVCLILYKRGQKIFHRKGGGRKTEFADRGKEELTKGN